VAFMLHRRYEPLLSDALNEKVTTDTYLNVFSERFEGCDWFKLAQNLEIWWAVIPKYSHFNDTALVK
jgi:hypothetical protein